MARSRRSLRYPKEIPLERYDVAVVGAGLAGLHCAKELGRAGLGVILIDGKTSLGRSIHTTGIFVRRTLEDFDLPGALLGPPVRRVTLYSPALRPLTLESAHDEFRIGRMGPLYAHILEECARLGVTWAPATRYMGCEATGPDSLLRLETEGRSRWVRARYVVGADGARSLVAQDLGLDVNRAWIVGVEEVVVEEMTAAKPQLHCFLDPRLAPGYLAWVAEDGEETHIGVGGYPSRFDPLRALSVFRERAASELGRAWGPCVERRGGRVPVGGILRRISNDRGLLIGDAAGAPSPLTAGGLDPCLRLSSLAARVIVQFLATSDPRELHPYSGDRFRSRFIARRFMRGALSVMRSPFLLEGACGLLRTPLLRPLASHVFFGETSFPDMGARFRASTTTARARS